MERIARLCESLANDRTLREVLAEAGVSNHQWQTLEIAMSTGADIATVASLVGQIVAVAEDLGVDVVGRVRKYYVPLPAGPTGTRTVRGWVCPHRNRCARTDFTSSEAPTCGLTRDPLRAVEASSG